MKFFKDHKVSEEIAIFTGWVLAIHFLELIILPSLIIPTQLLSNLSLTQRFFAIWTSSADTAHYMLVAKGGYNVANPAFFPMMPILLKLLGANPITAKILSIVLSCIFILSFRKLINIYKSQKYSKVIVLSFLAFPASFLITAPFSETLYLALSALAIYFAEKRKFPQSGILIAFATATRLVGIILVLYLFLKIIENGVLEIKKNISALLIAPLGIICYGIYLQLIKGDFSLMYKSHTAWGRGLSMANLEHLFMESKDLILQITGPVKPVAINLIHFGSIFFFLFLLFIAYRKISNALWIYCLLVIVIPLVSGTYSGIPRYILATFPLFIPLGKFLEEHKTIMYLYFFLAAFLQAFLIIRFFNFEVAA